MATLIEAFGAFGYLESIYNAFVVCFMTFRVFLSHLTKEVVAAPWDLYIPLGYN